MIGKLWLPYITMLTLVHPCIKCNLEREDFLYTYRPKAKLNSRTFNCFNDYKIRCYEAGEVTGQVQKKKGTSLAVKKLHYF